MEKNALAVIDDARNRGALMYIPQNLDCPKLFKLEASVIDVEPADFHEIEGKLVPRKELCDRIGDAAGVDFIAQHCGVRTETHDDEFGKRTVYIGFAQGKVRLSDGSWRSSTVEEYELDPVLRARAEGGGERKVLAFVKAARQRASTGARLRVIRQLTGMPTAFEAEKIGQKKGLAFSRVVLNTDQILSTPEGRRMATAAALGILPNLFGPQGNQQAPAQASEPEPRNVTPEADDTEEPDPFDAPPPAPPSAELSEAEKLLQSLVEYVASGCLRENGRVQCQAAIDRGETDLIVLRDLVQKAKAAYDARAGKVLA